MKKKKKEKRKKFSFTTLKFRKLKVPFKILKISTMLVILALCQKYLVSNNAKKTLKMSNATIFFEEKNHPLEKTRQMI